MYEDDYEPFLNGTEYELKTDDFERLEQAMAAERSAELELQMEQDEQKKQPKTDEPPERKN